MRPGLLIEWWSPNSVSNIITWIHDAKVASLWKSCDVTSTTASEWRLGVTVLTWKLQKFYPSSNSQEKNNHRPCNSVRAPKERGLSARWFFFSPRIFSHASQLDRLSSSHFINRRSNHKYDRNCLQLSSSQAQMIQQQDELLTGGH